MTPRGRRALFANTSFRDRVQLERNLRKAQEHAAAVAATAAVIAAECAKVDSLYEPLFQAELD